MGFNILEKIGWSSGTPSNELPELYPMPITLDQFVSIDIVTLYSKILTDVLERTQGLKEELKPLMWDNCMKNELPDGLVTMLAKAMATKKDLFLVYKPEVKLVRQATPQEMDQIKQDYVARGESKTGIQISFTNYKKSDMVRFYMTLEYCTVSSLYKSMNLSAAIQIKAKDLRSSTGAIDAADVISQAREIARALRNGRAVLINGEDEIATTTPDLTAIKEAISFGIQKLTYYLGLSKSYLGDDGQGGLGDSGERDIRQNEKGFQNFFYSIIKPVLESLFPDTKVTYKSQDTRFISTAIEALKGLEVVSEELISLENKQNVVNELFNFPKGTKGDPAPRVVTQLPPPQQT